MPNRRDQQPNYSSKAHEEKNPMLKGDIVDQICVEMDSLIKKDISQSVDIIIETMSNALANGQRIEIRGFGSFCSRERQPKTTKNPKTGVIMNIPRRKTLHFTMSKSLKYPLIKSGQQGDPAPPHE